jgi:hypothetical protein
MFTKITTSTIKNARLRVHGLPGHLKTKDHRPPKRNASIKETGSHDEREETRKNRRGTIHNQVEKRILIDRVEYGARPGVTTDMSALPGTKRWSCGLGQTWMKIENRSRDGTRGKQKIK